LVGYSGSGLGLCSVGDGKVAGGREWSALSRRLEGSRPSGGIVLHMSGRRVVGGCPCGCLGD
jgi:hypothetical protein